jgi:hypothetical protein
MQWEGGGSGPAGPSTGRLHGVPKTPVKAGRLVARHYPPRTARRHFHGSATIRPSMKPPDKKGRASAEAGCGRAWPKENVARCNTLPIQRAGEPACQGSNGVRRAVCHRHLTGKPCAAMSAGRDPCGTRSARAHARCRPRPTRRDLEHPHRDEALGCTTVASCAR